MKMKKCITSERANLFEPNVYISMVVKIANNVSTEAVSASIQTAYAANESTMSKIVLEDNSEAYYKRLGESGCNIIIDNRSWEEIIKASEKQAFDLKDGELVRTFIITESDEITLLIHAHHLAGDGKSMLILIKDILYSLDGKTPVFKPLLLIDYDYLIKRASLPFGIKMFVKSMNSRWLKKNKTFSWDDYYAVHEKYWSCHSSDFDIKTYNVDELKKQCVNGATINSILVTDVLKNSQESKITGIPVSIREDNDSMSNQTSGISVEYPYNDNKTFAENLAEMHRQIYRRLNRTNKKYFVLLFLTSLCPTLIDSVLLQSHGCYSDSLSEKMAEIMGYSDKKKSDIGISNLGKIHLPDSIDKIRVSDVIFIPPKISYSKEVIGAITLGNRLTVCRHKMKS